MCGGVCGCLGGVGLSSSASSITGVEELASSVGGGSGWVGE